MEDCWTVLGLEASTASEKDVKVAYARLVKVHRPDADLEGFQRTRFAYEAALASLRGTPPPSTILSAQTVEVAFGESVVPVVEAPSPPPASPEMLEINSALEKISLAAATRIRQKVREAMAEFDQLALKWRVPFEVQAQMLAQAFAHAENLFAELCGVDRIVRYAAAGETGLAHVVLKIWRREGDTKQLQQLAHALMKHGSLVASELGATVLVHAAVGLGMWEPDLAEQLSRKAFPHLSPGHRSELTAAVDHEILVGRIFMGFPKDHKTFWFAFIRGAGTRTNWRDSWSRELMSFLVRHCGPNWPGYPVLQQAMPPQVWDDMIRAMRML